MKKLTGMTKSFSSLENKKIKDLKSVQGGRLPESYVRSNFENEQGCCEFDHYNSDGGYVERIWCC